MYYGLFRISELTNSEHVVRAEDVLIATNKNKLLFVLRSSKNSGNDKKPQLIKIESTGKSYNNHDYETLCPYALLMNYIAARKTMKSDDEQFFVFRDRSPVSAYKL